MHNYTLPNNEELMNVFCAIVYFVQTTPGIIPSLSRFEFLKVIGNQKMN